MTAAAGGRIRRQRVTVRGVVQGVGFRPFVHRAAGGLGLGGWVRNAGSTVVIEVEGDEDRIDDFRRALEVDTPPLALVHEISAVDLEPIGHRAFEIIRSEDEISEQVLVTPDATTCSDCLAEIGDPVERRHRYAFTNCTNCGPRFTIVEDVPYDRDNTTMSSFEMCADCRAEYSDPSDRRFHAQPVCCPACGPTLSLVDAAGASAGEDALRSAANLLQDDKIVAVKGLGGYHLAALARSDEAVARLRSRKLREEKPFAVMVDGLDGARDLCEVGEVDKEMLLDIARPIVVMPRRIDSGIAAAVAPNTSDLGVMLPYTPLHTLMLEASGGPIVLTSGNVSDEPIAYRDEDARERLADIADAFLTHDRPIRTRTDDSVVREIAGKPMMMRRSRGYVPTPIHLPVRARRPILACGAELKNTVTIALGDQAVLSHHIGDLKNLETYTSFLDAIEHFERLFHVTPEVVAHDLHPSYLSTTFARDIAGVDLVGVQHHHAHVAACMVDNATSATVIGVAFDGLGYGPDGTVWGGEFLVADLTAFERVGCLEPIALPGGDAVMREPWRMAAAYLVHLGEADATDIALAHRQSRWQDVVALARSDLAGPTTSAGRLFDAIAALIGVRDTVSYEGQAAIELEQLVDPSEQRGYVAPLDGDSPFSVRGSALFAAALADLRAGVDVGRIAARFHIGLADAVALACDRIRESGGPSTVALSGGVFLNKVLSERVIAGLEQLGFRVLRHRGVPPNDGCISLGQVAVAAARDSHEFATQTPTI